MTITLQDLQVLNEKANLKGKPHGQSESPERLAFRIALIKYYESCALQRLAELAEDGERYRWLKEQELKVGSLAVHCRVYDGYHFGVPGHKLDAAIDFARATSVKEKGPCPLCGRTDPHSHTSGPGGMS
jgi:transposase